MVVELVLVVELAPMTEAAVVLTVCIWNDSQLFHSSLVFLDIDKFNHYVLILI